MFQKLTLAVVLVLFFIGQTFTGHAQWTQLGNSLNGTNASSYFGYSVAASDDGNIVAVGAPYSTGSNPESGSVSVYMYNGSSWLQLGSTIEGPVAYDYAGIGIDLSADGSRLAIGTVYDDANGTNSGNVRVFDFDGSNWVQVGSNINGEAANDQSGWRVSLSADGNTVGISTWANDGNGTNAGHVRIYNWNGSSWQQLGSDIDGETANEQSGYSMELSASGNIVAIGSPYNSDNGNLSGQVRVFQFNGSNWVQLGSDLNGNGLVDVFGSHLSLSDAGNRLAVGAPFSDSNGSDAGETRVFEYNGSNWVALGSPIMGVNAGDNTGYGVVLSGNGNRLSIASIYNGEAALQAGQVRVFEYNGSAWLQVGSNINGLEAGETLGIDAAMSADGTRLVLGAIGSNSAGPLYGQARVYHHPLAAGCPTGPAFSSSLPVILCPHYNANFTCTPTDASYSYQWYRNNIPVGTNSSVYAASLIGNYKVAISKIGCPTVTSAVQYVNPQPSLSPSGWQYACAGDPMVVSVDANSLGISYQWQLGNVSILGETNSSITTTAAGGYSCMITYAGGCPAKRTGNSCKRVNTNAQLCKTGEESQLGNGQLRLYPNPANSEVTIALRETTPTEAELTLFDNTGRTISSETIPTGTATFHLDLGDLQTGLYFIRISGESEVLRVSVVR